MVGLKGHLVLKMLLFAFSEIILLYDCMVQSSLKFSTELAHKRAPFILQQEKSFITILERDVTDAC